MNSEGENLRLGSTLQTSAEMRVMGEGKDASIDSKPSENKYMGEICSECGEARMLHPQLYVYTCPYCRYSYMIHPVSSVFSRGITILKQSKVRKSFKKQK